MPVVGADAPWRHWSPTRWAAPDRSADTGPLDLDLDHVAGLNETGRFLAPADPRRRTGDDDVAGHQGEDGRRVVDQPRDGEDHVPRVAGLDDLPVQARLDPELATGLDL